MKTFRQLVASERPLVLPGAHDAISARLIKRAGFKAYFNAIMPKELPPVPATLDGLVAIQAEGDYVTLSFVREYDDPAAKGKKYTTTWFDMFRIVNGKIVEHWDSATKGAVGPAAASATKK